MKKWLHIAAFTGCALLIGLRSGLAGDGTFDNLYIGNNAQIGTSSTHGSVTINGVTGTSAAPGLTVTGDGGVVFGGTFGTGAIPATGWGTRFIWYPGKSAFVGGYGPYVDQNIGTHSFAFGNSASALGEGSVAFGQSAASGTDGAAFGWSNSGGQYATSFDYAIANGDESFAANTSDAEGQDSAAVGLGGAFGVISFAAVASTAQGDQSAAIGDSAIATSYDSIVIGANNAPSPLSANGATQWDPSDELFVIGNGADWDHPHNAVVVQKDGTVTITKRQGDIVMGVYGSGNGD